MDMIGRIRRLHSRKKKSVREIARITGLSRNTISTLTADPPLHVVLLPPDGPAGSKCREATGSAPVAELTSQCALKIIVSRQAYPSQGHEMLFDAHTRSFAALGGVARRGIYECKGLPCS